MFVIIVAHFLLRRAARPGAGIVLLHVLAFAMALGTFVWCFINFPYADCRNGTIVDGCKTEKAAVPIDGVLMYISMASHGADTLGAYFLSPLWFFFTTWFSGTGGRLKVLVETEDVCRGGITRIISRKATTRKALLQLLWRNRRLINFRFSIPINTWTRLKLDPFSLNWTAVEARHGSDTLKGPLSACPWADGQSTFDESGESRRSQPDWIPHIRHFKIKYFFRTLNSGIWSCIRIEL